MVPQGPPPPLGGGQPVPPSLLRSNSSQSAFPSLVSPRNQFNNMNMLGNGNLPGASSLLHHQSFGNGAPSSTGAESDPLSNGMGFNHASSSYMSSPSGPHPNSTGGQVQGQQQQQFSNASVSQMLTDQQQGQQIDSHNFQQNQQFSVPSNSQQQQLQTLRAGLGGVGPVKIEGQVSNEQAPHQLRSLGSVKLEPQQLQSMRSLGSVKMEPHSDPSMFLHQQQQQHQHQQQQQQMLLSRQSSQAAAAAQILHQQRLMQQQQLLKNMPQQRAQLPPQFQQQNLPIRSPMKPVYEPGMCARRLTHYMYQQQHRPEDNNIEFWRKFVAEYFSPNAKKKWCVSMYGSGRQTTGVFPQDVWHCEICNRRPGRGFEATAEVLPRLFKIKYESGTLEELLYVDMPREYQNSSGQIVLDYAKAIQESVFEQLRVVRDGQLRLVFSPDLKICSWEFCARRHEELIPRRLLIPQVSQLGAAAQKCQAASQNASSSTSASELQNNCNMFVASARQLAKALEVPLVNDLGYTKRYVRCLQISEVVNSMKDLIDYSRETGTGPMESLTKFPRRTNPSPGFQGQPQQSDAHQQQQQTTGQNSNTDNHSQNINNPMNSMPASSSSNTTAALLHQNSINSRQPNSPYGPNPVQITSPGSSNTVPQNQTSPSPFQSPTPSSSANPQPNLHGPHMNNAVTSPNVSSQPANDADANDSQSSVQKIIHDMMMSSQTAGGRMGNNDGKNGSNILVGNGVANSAFGNQSVMVNGIRAALGNNSMSMNGRVGMGMGMGRDQSMNPQQQDMSNQLLSGLGAVNGYNNLQFDWKGSP